MLSLLITVLSAARSALRTRGALALENLVLRQQLAVLQRRRPRPPLDWLDRLFWVALSRAWWRYHRSRTHLSLSKDAPEARAVLSPEAGEVVELPEVGGLHHRYERHAA